VKFKKYHFKIHLGFGMLMTANREHLRNSECGEGLPQKFPDLAKGRTSRHPHLQTPLLLLLHLKTIPTFSHPALVPVMLCGAPLPHNSLFCWLACLQFTSDSIMGFRFWKKLFSPYKGHISLVFWIRKGGKKTEVLNR
jgi:hypothetical protein